jgi:hypothetical protein
MMIYGFRTQHILVIMENVVDGINKIRFTRFLAYSHTPPGCSNLIRKNIRRYVF